MGKIFRLHTKGKTSLEGWAESSHYTTQEIESIKDPAGASSLYRITSIPSPFANMDIVRNAFIMFKDKKFPLDGNTIYHKTVSDMLDVAQVFFYKDNLKNKHSVEILTWNVKNELEKLENSPNNTHKILSNTLKLHLEQDKETYNFDLLDNIYIIKIDNFVVGGTSPATLFFPSPNNLYEQGLKNLKFEDDILFDNEYNPLYKRSADFIKALFAMYEKYIILRERYATRLVWEYMERCLEEQIKVSNPALYKEIHSFTEETFDKEFERLETNKEGDYIQPIRGVYLGKVKEKNVQDSIVKSDFMIKPTVPKQEKNLPLVLPTQKFNLPLIYIASPWNPDTRVPYKVSEENIYQRILPGTTYKYPYLTVDDFLEPYLITLPYNLNTEHYFDGNFVPMKNSDNRRSYLIPLKPLFFEYFTLDDLETTVQADKKMFEMKQGSGGSVIVTLRIPVQKNEVITFERTYYEKSDNRPEISEDKNDGAVLKTKLNLTLYPILKINTGEYRIQLIDDNKKAKDAELTLFKNTEIIKNNVTTVHHTTKKEDDPAVYYYIVPADQQFDTIQLNLPSYNAKGIIIPKFKNTGSGMNRIDFAVDFGTTNTHIEYKLNDATPQPLTYASLVQYAAPLIAKNLDYELELTELGLLQKMHFFLCNQDKETKQYAFPIRTAILQSELVKMDKLNYALSDFNIGWTYHTDQHQYAPVSLYKTNLKWLSNDDPMNVQYKEKFIEEIVIHLSVLAAANGCSADRTTLTWFYPSSMTPGQIRKMEDVWEKSIEKHIPGTKQKNYPESYAPFYYYKGMNKIQGGSKNPAVSIDIGGGTTDIVVFQEMEPKLLSSFNFAGGVVFGSGFHKPSSNRLTEYYQKRYSELIKDSIRKYILNEVKSKPTEFNNFLFKISKSDPNLANNPALNYSTLLANDSEFKIALLYFYTTILYHIADMMAFKQMSPPTDISFSGTASKSLTIIANEKLMAEYATEIFKNFYPNIKSVKVFLEREIPKEITAKGGLYTKEETPNIRDIKEVYSGIPEKESLKWQDIDKDDTVLENYLKVVQKFHDTFKKLDEYLDFKDFFGIEYPVKNRFFTMMDEDTEQHYGDFIKDGYQFRAGMDSLEASRNMDESAFFYIPVGIIQSWFNYNYREEE